MPPRYLAVLAKRCQWVFEFLCALTGVVLIGGAIYAYQRSRDGFHPAIVIAPLFLYIYVSSPILGNTKGGLDRFFSVEELEYVAALNLATAFFFCAGLLRSPRRGATEVRAQIFAFFGRPHVRQRMFALALLLGLIALGAYIYSLESVGGFIKAYSRAKGGGRADSGYLGEAILLAFPAIVLLALSRRGSAIRPLDVAFGFLFALPHLLQGSFGGRRGPMFLVVAILLIAWFIAKGRTPSLRIGIIAIGAAGLAVLLVWSQRQHMYIGSEGEFDTRAFLQTVFSEEPSEGSTYVSGTATVLTADSLNKYYWGYRYLVTFFIRPIPKQLWPTKYEDVGADWLYRYGDEERSFEYTGVVGFALLAGSAPGSFADGYMEFSWGVLALFYLIGALYAWIWKKHRWEGGFWTVVFAVSLVMSIYLATQSVTAWGTRMVYICFFTYLIWRLWLKIPMSHRAVLVKARRSAAFGRTDAASMIGTRESALARTRAHPSTLPEAFAPRRR
jgi:oligosaccharide repeat unit polymerase